MRVSDNMNYAQVTSNLNRNRKEANDLNNQAATMKRVTKPSDDPAGTARVLSARTDIAGFTQYEKSLNQAKGFLEFSEQSLAELGESLIRLKELTIGQANGAGANAQTRRATAAEVEQLYQQAIYIGNRKMGDRYLFGGFKTTESPFTGSGTYKGDDGELMIEVNKGAYVPMNLPGSKVFLGKGFAVRTLVDVNDGVPRSPDELRQLQQEVEAEKRGEKNQEAQGPNMRGPASTKNTLGSLAADGENVFSVIRAVHTGLVTNDITTLQNSLERLDDAIEQVVMARSQIGSRVMTLNNTIESLSRQKLDSQTLASNVEDANAFELFSNISKNETALKATMESSSRLITPSLLDFLK